MFLRSHDSGSSPLSRLLIASLLLLSPWALWAQDEASPEPEAETEAAADPAEEPRSEIGDIIVVTASRTEQTLHEAPASVTVLTSEKLEQIPSDDYGDLLRNVPGLNVAQFSARDIQISGRQATSSLATNQLVLVDGRTLYLDFFGFVMWDFLPSDPREIKQIEVVRGPGSAVWGANAVNGVINLITKRPSEMVGTSVMVGGGELGTLYGSVSHAGATDRVGYKLSGAYYEQDPFDRPSGVIPGTSTPYPQFENQGTSQPKVDFRLDFDQTESAYWSIGAGYAGTDGIVHSGIGPFDIDTATMTFGRVQYSRGALQIGFFTNQLDGEANNLLTVGADGRPIPLNFETSTYNVEASHTYLVGSKNVLTYGANARTNSFDLSLAPGAEDRDELGVYVQDEIFFSDRFRWLIGARWDDLDPIGSVVSPRTSLAFSPNEDHTFRISYNRAFRSPSVINNELDTVTLNAVRLPPFDILYIFPSAAVGNPDLDREQLDAFEVGWVGTFDKAIVTLALYRNETEDQADFYPAVFYSAANPPPNWPLPPMFVPPNTFPQVFTYRNIGEITDRGVEFSLDYRANDEWSGFFNYSWQDEPEVVGIDPTELGRPPEHRANLGASFDQGIFFANGNVNYVDDAFWTDVLDSRFYGPTDSYTLVNLSFGWRLLDDKMTLQVSGQNVTDERVQQHVFGDIISRKVTGQILLRF